MFINMYPNAWLEIKTRWNEFSLKSDVPEKSVGSHTFTLGGDTFTPETIKHIHSAYQ